MVTVKFFGYARKAFGEKQIEIEAKDIKDVIKALCDRYNVKASEVKGSFFYVNDVNISQLKMYKTELRSGDVVMLLSPASGG